MEYCLIKSFEFKGNSLELLELFKEEPFVFSLGSYLTARSGGRFSLIGFDPYETFRHRSGNGLDLLKKKFLKYYQTIPVSALPFAAGILGFLSYDFGLHLENVSVRSKDDLLLPDFCFGFYDCVLTIDHWEKKLIVSSSGLPEKNSLLRKKRAQWRMEQVFKKLTRYWTAKEKSAQNVFGREEEKKELRGDIKSDFSRTVYLKAVEKILDYIRRGDVYQVNLSQRFELTQSGYERDPVRLYQRLCRVSPSNFCAYLDAGDFQIMSSSPERFLRKQKKIIQASPMKGTRPRGRNTTEDRSNRQDLLSSPKDRAELLMITDLVRNDLGRVCRYGSVKVKRMRRLEEYATVFQTTSTIEGTMRDDCDGFDAIKTCFPGGSVTGCPKIRAMEIIEELEPHHRGIYTGSLGYMNFRGDMDFNILIRTLLKYWNKIYFHAGGGIVADSVPEKEYDETLVKARALRLSLQGAGHG